MGHMSNEVFLNQQATDEQLKELADAVIAQL